MCARLPSEVSAVVPRIRKIRRYLHQHAEASNKEFGTAAIVQRELEDCGLRVQRIGATGVVGLLKGARPGLTVGLRADMDALEMPDETGLPYASDNGCAHACGHDGHTAVLIGAARVLSAKRGRIRGNVKFIFQPAEEHGGGGNMMCQAGVMESPKVDAVFALHAWPGLRVGSIATRGGPLLAYSDGVNLTVVGRGGHGAQPHNTIDPVLISARIIEGLQSIVSRELRPGTPAVVTMAAIHGGNAFNVIPDRVDITGTVRTMEPDRRKQVFAAVERIAKGIAAAHGAKCMVKFHEGYPATINDRRMAQFVLDLAARVLGPSKSVTLEHVSLGGEDFCYYLQKAPGCFFRLGMDEPGRNWPPLHNSKFDFNDRALGAGVHMMTQVALGFLGKRRDR